MSKDFGSYTNALYHLKELEKHQSLLNYEVKELFLATLERAHEQTGYRVFKVFDKFVRELDATFGWTPKSSINKSSLSILFSTNVPNKDKAYEIFKNDNKYAAEFRLENFSGNIGLTYSSYDWCRAGRGASEKTIKDAFFAEDSHTVNVRVNIAFHGNLKAALSEGELSDLFHVVHSEVLRHI